MLHHCYTTILKRSLPALLIIAAWWGMSSSAPCLSPSPVPQPFSIINTHQSITWTVLGLDAYCFSSPRALRPARVACDVLFCSVLRRERKWALVICSQRMNSAWTLARLWRAVLLSVDASNKFANPQSDNYTEIDTTLPGSLRSNYACKFGIIGAAATKLAAANPTGSRTSRAPPRSQNYLRR